MAEKRETETGMKCIDTTQRDTCCGCGVCLLVCPQSCITMARDEEGFDYPVIDEAKCIQCGKCHDVCPFINRPDQQGFRPKPPAYVAWNKDEKVRLASSSGGVFTALAENILAKGGVVFGAAFENNFRSVRHVAVETPDGLAKLRGSKYVQSSTVNAFRQVRQILASGRQVLFSGTPCQVAGLRSLIGSNTGSLLTCDFACHGVPSPGVFAKYIKEQSQKFGALTTAYHFRDKEQGWNFPMVRQLFENGYLYSTWNWGDPFMHGFLKDVILRPSCYICKFTSFPRPSDITLADYWGIATKYPQYDDNRGVSLVLVNSISGNKLFNDCKGRLFNAACDLDHAISHNSHLTRPATMPEIRTFFFEANKTKSFEQASQTYVKIGTLLKRKCTRTLRKILFSIRGLLYQSKTRRAGNYCATKDDWASLRYRNELSIRNKLRRLVWNVVWVLLFRPTPRWTLKGWRRLLLRAFGARIGPGSSICPSCRIWAPWNLTMGSFSCLGDRVDCYCIAPIMLGSKVTVSQDSFLCCASHDIGTLTRELIISPIVIENHAWLTSRTFIGPGVTIGEGAVVGACAVVTKDVEAWTVVSGNPAKFVKKRELKEK